MKTKFDWLALLASAAMIAQANAGGHHGGGGSSGGDVAAAAPAPARSGPVSSVGSKPMRNFGGGRTMPLPDQRFRQPDVNSGMPISARRVAPAATSHVNTLPRFSNSESHGS